MKNTSSSAIHCLTLLLFLLISIGAPAQQVKYEYGESKAYQVIIYTDSGKELLNIGLNRQNKEIDVSKFNSGIYFLRVLNAEKTEVSVRKLIIQK